MTCQGSIRRAATGHRIGEQHPRAQLSDEEVDTIRELHDVHGLSYGKLAVKYGTPKSTIGNICNYTRR